LASVDGNNLADRFGITIDADQNPAHAWVALAGEDTL
jgi:hypothetical protein